ncbi:N-acetylglucosamine-1-phosphotransferase subunits alpha/beta-like [Amphiura filiformis]|uniref:N-acetylglucosamine-1-phosphotransferase subunits alpha/beta-like n=1 Tax=Amphiura filiformis TaxID=82378 RepID=UPI003B219EEB
MFKLVQKQTYTVLSHRYSVLLIFTGIVFVLVSAFQFGEVAMEWSRDQYSALFNIYHDNIAGVAFQNRMCLPIPIDAVYTWVNGSDPKLMADLRKVKWELELKRNHSSSTESPNNKTNSIQCKLQDCLPIQLVVLDTALPASVNLQQLGEAHPSFAQASRLFNVTKDGGLVVSVVEFNKRNEVDTLLRGEHIVYLGNKNISLSRGYLTSDWTAEKSISMKELILVSGITKDVTEETVRNAIPEEQRQHVSKIEIDVIAGMAVLTLSNTDAAKGIISEKTEDDALHFMSSYLIWGLEHDVPAAGGEVSASRFEDNEELRYSLRSLEKHAPWIRHVYIVTNGQIPSWLNLDNPRMTLVSHSEIFPNKTHLPSFSSPAIESHLHRIPGLSKKFIYLNDDTMFGKEVWPDDFYTHARGQKVYLTWPVPNCAEGCPSSWIRDNYCDKACNTSECDWDGGDCDASRTGGDTAQGGQAGGAYLEQMYCNSGCANGWVADKYCDQACNVQQCGFDAGDCGTVNFHRLHSVKIERPTEVTLPRGLTVAFFNVSTIFSPNGSISEGKYMNNKAVRTATVAQKFFTVHLLLYKNISETTVTFTIAGKKSDVPVNVTFNVTINTLPVEERAVSIISEDAGDAKDKGANKTRVASEEENFLFPDVDQQLRGPHKPLKPVGDFPGDVDIPVPDLLPEDVATKLKQLDEQLEQGDLTEKGFKKQKTKILKEYRQSPDYKTKRDAALKSQLVNNDNLQDKAMPNQGHGMDVKPNDPNMEQQIPNMDQHVPNMGQGQHQQIPNMGQQAPNMEQHKPKLEDHVDLDRIMSARKRAEEREKGLHKRQQAKDNMLGGEQKLGMAVGGEQPLQNLGQPKWNQMQNMGEGMGQMGVGQQLPGMGQQVLNAGQQPGFGQQGGLRQPGPGQIGVGQQGPGMGQQVPNMGQQMPNAGQQPVFGQQGGLRQPVPGQMGVGQQGPGMGQQVPNMGQQFPNVGLQPGFGQQGGVLQQAPGQIGVGQQGPGMGQQVPLMGQQIPNVGQQVPGLPQQGGVRQPAPGHIPGGGQQMPNQQVPVLKQGAPARGQNVAHQQGQFVGQQPLQNMGQGQHVGEQLLNAGQHPVGGQQVPHVDPKLPNVGLQDQNNLNNAIPDLNQGQLNQAPIGGIQPRGVPNNVINPNLELDNNAGPNQQDQADKELQGEGDLKRQKRDDVVQIEDDEGADDIEPNREQREDGQKADDIDNNFENQQARLRDMNIFYAKKDADGIDDKQVLNRRLLSVVQSDTDNIRYNVSKADYGEPFREHFDTKSQTSSDEIVKYNPNKPSKDTVNGKIVHNVKVGKFETMRITEGYEGGNMKKKKVFGVASVKSSKTKMDETLDQSSSRRDALLADDVAEDAEQELRRTEEKKEKLSRMTSFLPWERNDVLYNITQLLSMKNADAQSAYETKNPLQRKLMDAFSDSLRYVNKIYNIKFGFTSRKVPAHMPHMIDVDIMNELQDEFAKEYDLTSSHQVRHSQDMQFAFSYMYYIIGAPKEVNVTEVFDEFDTDSSGILSDREIRTLATRLYDLPLDLKTLTNLENIIINCSKYQPSDAAGASLVTEKYYEQNMPQVSKWLVSHCDPLIQLMGQSVEGQTKYRHELMGEDEIAFKMIRTNVSQVIGQLDDIRKNPRKFICLNDNIEHETGDSSMVKAVLQDFYESLFPIISQFELPREYRNRFLHIDELREWRRYRDWLRFWTHLSLGGLIVFSIASFCSTQLRALKRRCCPRRRVRSHDIAEKVQHETK